MTFIAMVSDFFYPNTGGVEAHIWQLSQCLIKLGHKVIVITHAYGDRVGIRYMADGLKVYYLPILLYPKQNIIWPLMFHTLSYTRQILIREQVDIVHGHSAFSPLAHEVMFHAKCLGINTIFTDHSLFGFNDIGAIIHTHCVKVSLLQCNHIICVSQVGRGNKALQLKVSSEKFVPITVIPNAVDTLVFKPDPSKRDPDKITIVVNSRLVYRKGIDLLAAVIPKVCQLNTKVQFIIAGDGPKKILLKDAVEKHDLHGRVTFLGSVPHSQVRGILVKGDIFLNTSLIEAFCMAVVEAASCGLQVVSTNVGGLPSVLPKELIKLTEPNVDSLVMGVQSAIDDLSAGRYVNPIEAHKMIKKSYSWIDVAKQTDRVYSSVMQEPALCLTGRIKLYQQPGTLVESLYKWTFILLMIVNYLFLMILDCIYPRREIDHCPRTGEKKKENPTVLENVNSFYHETSLAYKN